MKRKKVFSVVLALVLMLLLLSGCADSTGSAGENTKTETIVLRLASDAPSEHIATELNKEACDLVFERTEGRVKVDYYPASQLGGYETVYEELMMGTIDLAQIAVPDSLNQKLGVAYMPYYATNYDEFKVLYAPDAFISKEFGKLTEENGVTFLGWFLEGFQGIATTVEPTNALIPGADKGIQTRTSPFQITRIMMEDLGFKTVTVPYGEVPTAIQTGVVDGWIGGTVNINYSWVGEIINYMYVNNVQPESTAYVMSDKSLEKLSEEDQQIVREVFAEQSMKSFDKAYENERVYVQKLKDDYGVKVIELTQDQLDEWATYIRDVTWTHLEDILSKELVDGLRAELTSLNMD